MDNNNSFLVFCENYDPSIMTDKFDLGYMHLFYDKLLTPRKYTARGVLEIGVQSGKSILLWNNYFPNAFILGIDIAPGLLVGQKMVVERWDAYTTETTNHLELSGKRFDIIIDDGPHTFDSMVFFLTHYPKLLREGGVLVLEDIIDTSWTPELVKLLPGCTVYHAGGHQRTEHLLNLWSKGLDVIVWEK